MKNHQRILQLADELRLSIAEWANGVKEADVEKLGEKLQPLRTDLAEMVDGSYDPSRMLGE